MMYSKSEFLAQHRMRIMRKLKIGSKSYVCYSKSILTQYTEVLKYIVCILFGCHAVPQRDHDKYVLPHSYMK